MDLAYSGPNSGFERQKIQVACLYGLRRAWNQGIPATDEDDNATFTEAGDICLNEVEGCEEEVEVEEEGEEEDYPWISADPVNSFGHWATAVTASAFK